MFRFFNVSIDIILKGISKLSSLSVNAVLNSACFLLCRVVNQLVGRGEGSLEGPGLRKFR